MKLDLIETNTSLPLHHDTAVAARYSQAAQQKESALCCPIEYDPALLKVIPDEVLERDYGCGDPSPYVKTGDTVLDLGSGGGKLCFMTSQLVGPAGQVIGVDCNQEMLNLARSHQSTVAERIGYDNISFRCGMIQDLQLDLEQYAHEVDSLQSTGVERVHAARKIQEQLRAERPLIPDESVDCVVSNCVLNLVRPDDRRQLFREVFRVLKRGGRAAISDIVADENVPESMQNNPELWSGCISGAWREDQFLREFEEAGFHGIEIAKFESKPWQTVEGIEFRSVTVLAWKGKQGPCLDRNQAVIYRGPFKKVEDDDGHVYPRGQRIAVCDKTYRLLQQDAYADSFLPIEPNDEVPLESATEMDCRRNAIRDPRETKGQNYRVTNTQSDGCDDSGSCC